MRECARAGEGRVQGTDVAVRDEFGRVFCRGLVRGSPESLRAAARVDTNVAASSKLQARVNNAGLCCAGWCRNLRFNRVMQAVVELWAPVSNAAQLAAKRSRRTWIAVNH